MTERTKSNRPKNGGNDHSPISPEEWASAIRARWQKAVESIIEAGRLLIAARDALPHGEFGKMVRERLPFKWRTADYLMSIAEHGVLGDSQFIANLPPSWATLGDLAALPDDAVRELIASGKINAEMRRADAAEIIKQHREEGLYKFERVLEALSVLVTFMLKWPDAAVLAGHLFNDMEEGDGPDLGDLPKVSRWVTDLHAALAAEHEKMDQQWQDAEDAERAELDKRVTAMADNELKALVYGRKTPLTERSRARVEAKRRNLPWQNEDAPPPKRNSGAGPVCDR